MSEGSEQAKQYTYLDTFWGLKLHLIVPDRSWSECGLWGGKTTKINRATPADEVEICVRCLVLHKQRVARAEAKQ